MEVEQRCVIRFLMLEGCCAEQIHDRLIRAYAEGAFSLEISEFSRSNLPPNFLTS
jgi:hypothetical protein